MTSLTDRMRTCAARIASITDPARNDHSINDAVDLLIEASNIIEAAQLGTVVVDDETAKALGLPMEIIEPSHTPVPPTTGQRPSDFWIAPGGPLPGLTRSGTISPRACPRCDSRANKRVHRQGNSLVLECSVCGHAWKYT